MRSLYPISCLESGERQFAGYIYRQYQRRCFFSGCRVRISSASTPSSLLPFADPRSHRSSVALVLRHQHQQYPRRNRKLDQPLSSAFPLLFSFRAEHILHFDRRAPLLRPITHTGRIMGPAVCKPPTAQPRLQLYYYHPGHDYDYDTITNPAVPWPSSRSSKCSELNIYTPSSFLYAVG